MKHIAQCLAVLLIVVCFFSTAVLPAGRAVPETYVTASTSAKPVTVLSIDPVPLLHISNSESGSEATREPEQIKTPAPTPKPCPITDAEIIMLAKTMYKESQVVYWNGDKWGIDYIARQAAVGWCALNRLDADGFCDTLAEVLTSPNAFAYDPNTEVTEHFRWLAEDIVDRWWAEKQGCSDVGRTLPADYFFFGGDGRENHFRKEFKDTGDYWDWSLPSPYEMEDVYENYQAQCAVHYAR